MIKTYLLISVFLTVAVIQAGAQATKIKRRSDSFFGIHFDFHANPEDNQIGRGLQPLEVASFLKEVKPDYIQVDTKGHPGIASYPTRIGIAASGIVKDPLRIFRDETRKQGIGLYSHFSGVEDIGAARNHPDWARVNANGQRDGASTSLFSNYCDQYFIPQLEEVSKNYGVDGFWIDGECWAVQADFSEAAKKAYTQATHNQPALNNDYMQFTRQAFHRYLAHYTRVLHQFNPQLQMASNWAFSSYMPGPVDAGVDFLSGDVVNDDINNVEFQARTISEQGRPWDLMIWGFMGDKNGQGHYWKSARMLEQKGAAIIAQGGGYEVYINQNHDATIPLSTAGTLKEVAGFCKARKTYCFKSAPVPQIAMLFSGEGHNYDLGTATAFNQDNGGNDNIKGTMAMLLGSQYPVQVLQEYNLTPANLSKFPLLVITEWNYLNPAFISEVERYVYNGGKVLAVGGVTCGLFNQILGQAGNQQAGPLPVKEQRYGKGVMIGIPANISLKYLNAPDVQTKQAVAGLVKELFPAPLVSVTGSDQVHVALRRKNNTAMIHLINAGSQFKVLGNNQLEFQLPPVGSLHIMYATHSKPAAVILQPGNVSLKYTYAGNSVSFDVPGVDIYSIVEIK